MSLVQFQPSMVTELSDRPIIDRWGKNRSIKDENRLSCEIRLQAEQRHDHHYTSKPLQLVISKRSSIALNPLSYARLIATASRRWTSLDALAAP